MRWMRNRAFAALGLAALGVLPGCVISVGSSHAKSQDERLDQLENRVRDAEQRLGIPSPEKEAS